MLNEDLRISHKHLIVSFIILFFSTNAYSYDYQFKNCYIEYANPKSLKIYEKNSFDEMINLPSISSVFSEKVEIKPQIFQNNIKIKKYLDFEILTNGYNLSIAYQTEKDEILVKDYPLKKTIETSNLIRMNYSDPYLGWDYPEIIINKETDEIQLKSKLIFPNVKTNVEIFNLKCQKFKNKKISYKTNKKNSNLDWLTFSIIAIIAMFLGFAVGRYKKNS